MCGLAISIGVFAIFVTAAIYCCIKINGDDRPKHP